MQVLTPIRVLLLAASRAHHVQSALQRDRTTTEVVDAEVEPVRARPAALRTPRVTYVYVVRAPDAGLIRRVLPHIQRAAVGQVDRTVEAIDRDVFVCEVVAGDRPE